MYSFEVDDYVRWTNEAGETCFGRILDIDGDTVHIMADYRFIESMPISAVSHLEPIVLGAEEYRRLVRFESDIEELLRDNCEENIINRDGYEITVEDLLAALGQLSDITFSEDIDEGVQLWFSFIGGAICDQDELTAKELYTERDAIRYMYESIESLIDGFDPYGIKGAIFIGERFIEDRGKPSAERWYPEYLKRLILAQLKDGNSMNKADEERVVLYRRFAEELAECGDKAGLEAVGYGCYGGNRAFGCDWQRARECFLRLFEKVDVMPDRAFYANTLGYIYYYGRCNGGVPEYGEAFKYFSFAAFNGVYEAKYKIADMYKNGYGVVKSPETSDNIIRELYYENLKYICDGEFDCKFADVALRMGSLFEEEEHTSYAEALYYYLQADFAIRKRMETGDCYGDEKVCRAISEALDRVRAAIGAEPKKSCRLYSLKELFEYELENRGKIDLVIKKSGENRYKMIFSAHRKSGEEKGKKLFITLPEIEFCDLVDKLTVSYRSSEPLPEQLLDRKLTVDEIGFNCFLCDGDVLFERNGYFTVRKSKRG